MQAKCTPNDTTDTMQVSSNSPSNDTPDTSQVGRYVSKSNNVYNFSIYFAKVLLH